jgi:hypothetical protein
MPLILCNQCTQHHYSHEKECPHCRAPRFSRLKSGSKRAGIAMLLGFSLVACGEESKDSAAEPSDEPAAEPATEPATEPANEADYGVPMVPTSFDHISHSDSDQ